MVGGSVATAFFGSCCALPLLLISLGVGGMGFAAALVPYQIYFIGATILTLGISFYLVYGKKSESCDEAQLCSPRSQKITKIMLWVATILAFIFIVGPKIAEKFLL